MRRSISFTLNGKPVQLTVDDDRMLLCAQQPKSFASCDCFQRGRLSRRQSELRLRGAVRQQAASVLSSTAVPRRTDFPFGVSPSADDDSRLGSIAEVQLFDVAGLTVRNGHIYYFGIHVKDCCSTFPSASHFLQSNFTEPVAIPSIRLSDMRSISRSVSRLHQLVKFRAYAPRPFVYVQGRRRWVFPRHFPSELFFSSLRWNPPAVFTSGGMLTQST